MLDNDFDFKIISHISKFPKIEEPKLLEIFPDNNFSTKGRLKVLKERKFIDRFPKMRTIPDLTKKPNFYVITDLGKKVIQDYLLSSKKLKSENRRKFILDFLPVVISIIALLKSFEKELIYIWQQVTLLLK